MRKQFIFVSLIALGLTSCGGASMPSLFQSDDDVFSCDIGALETKRDSYYTRADNLQSKLNQKLVKGNVELRHNNVKEIINGVENIKNEIGGKYKNAEDSCDALAICANDNGLNACTGQNRTWAQADLSFDKLNGRLDSLTKGVGKIDKIKFPKKPTIEMNTNKKCEQVGDTVFTECSD